jgi:hypothetical protein
MDPQQLLGNALNTNPNGTRNPIVNLSPGLSVNGYSWLPNGTGGVNYFRGSTPISNTEYRTYTNQDSSIIEQQAAQQYAIDNPTPKTPTNNLVGNGASQYKNTTASQAATQQSIDSLDPALANSLAGITSNFDTIMANYAGENALNQDNYNKQVTSNEQTRSNNNQAALLAAAQGGRGMRATLASLGSLDGTGQLLANRAIASSANADIGAGNKVFDTNATQLDNAWNATQFDQKKRDAEAIAARADAESAARQNVAQQRQSLYEKMAGFKADAGNQAGADQFTRMMGDLAPQTINARPAPTAYAQRNIGFEAGKLGSYLGGNNDLTVKTAAGNTGGQTPALNSPLYALTRKKDLGLA